MLKQISTVILVIGLAAVGYALFAQTGSNMTFYYEVDQVAPDEVAGDRIKLSGIVRPGTIERDPATLRTDFVVAGAARGYEVTYTGPVPDIFRDGVQVVVTGTFAEGTTHFVADELLAKCPSKYQAEASRKDFEHLDNYEIEYDWRKKGHPEDIPLPNQQ
ncbi:MAG: cytochrome c maturation protein CcmE [Candidatus Dadabacteria bacterium]|nr:MAG: cytochrome c maturation protein CcmE [Candidatus Dadabacteria bacterium]